MNVRDVNNPLVGGEVAKGKQAAERRETERTERNSGAVKGRQDADVQATRDTEIKPVRDVYESTENRKLAAELASEIRDIEPEPREEAVNRARDRVQRGYYNSPEFLDRLAEKLVDTGVARL